MSWSQILLLAAILILFLAWRRARSQTAEMRLRIEEHRAANSFTIEASTDDGDRSLIILDAGGRRVDPATLSWDSHGLERLVAAMEEQSPALLPGTPVELVREADDVSVWTSAMDERIGTLEAAAAGAIRARLEEGAVGSCVVLRQPAADRRLELLLIHSAVDVEI